VKMPSTNDRFFAHPTALVESSAIGEGTRIWAFCHVLKGAVIGQNCNLGDHSFIEAGVRIGNNVVIKNGVSLWEGITIEDRVFIGPNAAFVNDYIPRAKVYHAEYGKTLIREGASIGSNATVLCNLTIGRFVLVGAGSVVTRDVGDYSMVYGNPAVARGFVCECGKKLAFDRAHRARCKCGRNYGRERNSVRCISAE
jgi:UDP-2-acetamido-3-amino-2,3-dideoxy-glucuronate N-acetyltransferase